MRVTLGPLDLEVVPQGSRTEGGFCDVSARSVVGRPGDINARVTDSVSLDELLVKIKAELAALGPLIDWRSCRGGREPSPLARFWRGGPSRVPAPGPGRRFV
jgi:hypothetical protein